MNRSPSHSLFLRPPGRGRLALLAVAAAGALVVPTVALSGSSGGASRSAAGLTPAQAAKRARGYLLPHPEAYARAKQVADGRATVASTSAPAHPWTSWPGASDPSVTPPDSTGAIGTTRYVELVNLEFAIFDRSGTQLSAGGLDTFTGDSIDGLSDPQVIWDPDTNRFYYAVLDYLSDHFEVGFSKTDSPSSASDFCKYDVDFGYGSDLPDYPKLGDTSDFLLIGSNVFASGLFFDRADVAWLAKPAAGAIGSCPSALSSGWPLSTGVKQDLRNSDSSQADTPVPADQIDGSGTGWVVSAYDAGNRLSLFKVTKNLDGTANIAGTASSVSVSAFSAPPSASQKGSSEELDTLDGRLTQAVSAVDPAHGGVAIWTQHTIAGGLGSAVRWYEINPAGPSTWQSGTVSSASLDVFNGAVSPDRVVNGSATAFGSNMVLGFDTASSNAYPAIQMVTKTGSGATTAFQLVKQSGGPNVDFSCDTSSGFPCRWGDYSGATPDPAASTSGATGTVWLANQYNKSTGNTSDVDWLTWIWSASPGAGATGPPTIGGFNPTSGPGGTQVVITGTNFVNVRSVALVKGTISKSATFTVDSPTQITATVPSGIPSGVTASWRVVTSAGSATSAGLFTVTSGGGGGGGGGAPTITGFSPTSGHAGSQVVITGTNFVNVTAVAVTKGTNSKAASFTVNSATQITATVPSIPAGVTVNWKVTTTAGSATSAGLFTVT